MRSQERRLLSLVMSFAVAVQSVWPTLALAHDSEKDKQLNPAAVEADFSKPSAGQPRSSIPQDQFLLWMQTVYPSQIPAVSRLGGEKRRVWKLSTLIQKTDEMLKAALANNVPPTKYAIVEDQLDEEGLRKAAIEWINTGRRVDTPLFLWNRQKNPEALIKVRAILTEMADRWISARNYNGMNPTDAPMNTQTRYLNWWELTVNLQTSNPNDQRSLGDYNLKEAGAMTSAFQGLSCETEDCRFNFKIGGNFIHSFGIPTRSIVNLGPYVVFTHPDSYDAQDGFQYLSFIDLEAYEGSLGNEDLPVFRYLAPIQGKGPAKKLTVNGGKVYADGVAVASVADLKLASQLQQTVVNLKANLLDPNEWKNILPLADSFAAYTHKMIRNAIDTNAADMESDQKVLEGLEKLGKELATELKDLKGMRDVETGILKVDAKVATQMETVGKAMKAATERKKHVHLYMSGISRLVKKLWSPKPYASQIIKQAVGVSLARAHIKASVNDKMNWLYRLADRPFTNAGVIGYTAMGLGAPEAFHALNTQALQFGSALASYFVFAASGIGESIATGAQKTLQPFYSPISTMLEQYGIHGRWMKTMVGVPVFFGFLLSIYFSGHFVFNMKELWKDSQRHGYKGFRARQKEFTDAYYKRISDAEAKERQTDVTFSPEEEVQIAAWKQQRLQERKEAEEQAMSKRLLSDRNGLSYLAYAKMRLKPVTDTIGSGYTMTRDGVCAVASGVRTGVCAVVNGVRTGLSAVATPLRGWFSKKKTQEEAQLGLPLKLEQHDQDVVAASMDQAVEDLSSAAAQVGESKEVQQAAQMDLGEWNSRWKAMSSFMFSLPALDLTLGTWIRKWNTWAGWRFCTAGFCSYKVPYTDYPFMIKPKPVALALRITYPTMFDTAVAARKGTATFPTDLNGGRITRLDSWGRRFASMIKLMSSTGAEFDENLRPAEGKHATALAAFEDQIIDVEQKVVKVAFQSALRGLVNFAKTPKDLQILYGGHGLNHLTDSKVRELSRRSQTYLRTHFQAVYDDAMGRFMREVVASDDTEELTREFFLEAARKAPNSRLADEALAKLDSEDELTGVPDDLSVEAIKEMMVRVAEAENRRDYGFDLKRAEAIAEAAAKENEAQHVAKAIEQAGKTPDLNILLEATKQNFLASVDPQQNRSMARYAQVDERLDLPLARSRAVRAEVMKLLVTLPIDVGFKLVLTAGIMEGAFKPLQEHMWGPNSTAYLSHTSFYGVMGTGFAIGMMADAWMKLQQDARQDNMKLFGQIPKGEDAEKSFMRYYMKQMNAPENSMWENYKYSNFLSFWNTPAALVNIGGFYMITMGRVDVSLLASMYIVGYLTPFSAIQMKLDQAFERSAYFTSRGVASDKWLAHPDVVKLTTEDGLALRGRFQLLNDIYLNGQGNLAGNIESVPTTLGPRGLVRAAFAGLLPEERIVNGIIRPLSSLANVPVIGAPVSAILSGCEKLLTNGNPDLIRLKK